MWRKRKRENLERDEEERITAKRWEEKWKEEKAEEIMAGIWDKDGKKLSVSHLFTLETPKFISIQVITEKNQEVQVPSHSEVAAASRPRKSILLEAKWQEREKKTGKVYKPSKRDTAPLKRVNWKSPTYWPMIEAAARRQTGKPNLSKLAKHLQDLHPHFKHLTHQHLSEWRDKTVKDQIEWSKRLLLLSRRSSFLVAIKQITMYL